MLLEAIELADHLNQSFKPNEIPVKELFLKKNWAERVTFKMTSLPMSVTHYSQRNPLYYEYPLFIRTI